MHGSSFIQPLQFGEWPIDKVESLIKEIATKYDNIDDYEISHVDRGGYIKCTGYGEHQACDELIGTFGKIVWILKS